MTDFLLEMVASSYRRARAAQAVRPLARPASPGLRRRLIEALSAASCAAPGADPADAPLALIAEIKRRSPSKGDLAPELDAAEQALAYEAAGAQAISVLTEPDRFGGSLDDLRDVAAAVSVPVLRKDFIVDPYQVWEAADAGAAAVLLVVAALAHGGLSTLIDECHECGLDALVEVHDEDDLELALSMGVSLIGVNNRDLHTLEVALETTEYLAESLPPCVTLVSESGIQTPADARRVRRAGARAVLVGEALVIAPRPRLAGTIAGLRGDGGAP